MDSNAKKKISRLMMNLGFLASAYLLDYFEIFAPYMVSTLKIQNVILIIVNFLPLTSFDPYKHLTALLRCVVLFVALSNEPSSNYTISVVATMMNGFFIGIEIDGGIYQLLHAICTLLPGVIIGVYKNAFRFSTHEETEIIRIIWGISVNFLFICAVSVINKKTRLATLKKLELAYAELREVNSKNEEMNKNLKQILEDKDNFILLFSHETRNPLNILLGNLTLLLEEIQAPHLRTKLLRSKFCANLLLHHLNNILDTGKLTNKNMLEVTPVKMRTLEFLQSICDFMEMMLKKKGLKPQVFVSRYIPRFLLLDPQRITQILLNLINNAAKFTASGSVSLNVNYLDKSQLEEEDFSPTTRLGYKLIRTDRRENSNNTSEDINEFDGATLNNYVNEFHRELISHNWTNRSLVEPLNRGKGYLKFEITDTGCGIREEDLRKLFKKFTQVHSEESQRQIGTGLGLWISKNLSHLMEGDIRVYSKPNFGTCFVVIIGTESPPTDRNSNKSSVESVIGSPPARTEKRNKKIIIADDDPDNLDLHKQLLKNSGWENLVTAQNGRELVNVFESLRAEEVYGVITDVSMPVLDGITAAKHIREIETKRGTRAKDRVKIGFITGHSNHDDKLLCQQSPINAWFYVSKPVTTAILDGYLQLKSDLDKRRTSLRQEASLRQELLKREDKFVVLCVDDDVFSLEMLECMLLEFNARVLKAQSGKEALSILEKQSNSNLSIDLVLMDCNMPEMDGWMTSQKIRDMIEENNLNKKILIVGVSGDSGRGNNEKMKKSGIQDWIQKPIHREDLSKIFQRLVSNLN